MLTKIKRQNCIEKYPIFPLRRYDAKKDEEEFLYPAVLSTYVLTLPSKTFQGHAKALGIELAKLTKAFSADALIFLGDTETPWLYQDNDYKPVKEAQAYLTDCKVGKRFNGALQIEIPALPTFAKHLAWPTHCNAALPYFHFIDKEQNIVGNICKYGNLHLDTLNEAADEALKSFVTNSKFEYGDIKSCTNWFSKTSAIPSRQTPV